MESNEKNLPSFCANHPKARIRKEYDEVHYVMNGIPVGLGIKKNIHYYCNICNRELCSKEEYERRIK